MTICILSPAPDEPNFMSRYLMAERTDYAEQTLSANAIDDQLINATRRIICYEQPIYDDGRLEVSEYAGLTLGVNKDGTTVFTEVQELYNFASIRILDDDSEFACSCIIVIHPLDLCLRPGARVGLERTFYSVSEGVGVVELCAVVYEPNITCPIEFPFNIRLSTADGTAGMIYFYHMHWTSIVHYNTRLEAVNVKTNFLQGVQQIIEHLV